jgi:hypothetical protein
MCADNTGRIGKTSRAPCAQARWGKHRRFWGKHRRFHLTMAPTGRRSEWDKAPPTNRNRRLERKRASSRVSSAKHRAGKNNSKTILLATLLVAAASAVLAQLGDSHPTAPRVLPTWEHTPPTYGSWIGEPVPFGDALDLEAARKLYRARLLGSQTLRAGGRQYVNETLHDGTMLPAGVEVVCRTDGDRDIHVRVESGRATVLRVRRLSKDHPLLPLVVASGDTDA